MTYPGSARRFPHPHPTCQILLDDIDNLRDLERRKQYHGEVKMDRYGRQIPKHAHGTANLEGVYRLL